MTTFCFGVYIVNLSIFEIQVFRQVPGRKVYCQANIKNKITFIMKNLLGYIKLTKNVRYLLVKRPSDLEAYLLSYCVFPRMSLL